MKKYAYVVEIWGINPQWGMPEEDYISQVLGEHLEDNHENVEVAVTFVGERKV